MAGPRSCTEATLWLNLRTGRGGTQASTLPCTSIRSATCGNACRGLDFERAPRRSPRSRDPHLRASSSILVQWPVVVPSDFSGQPALESEPVHQIVFKPSFRTCLVTQELSGPAENQERPDVRRGSKAMADVNRPEASSWKPSVGRFEGLTR